MPVRRSEHGRGGLVLDLVDRWDLPEDMEHDPYSYDEHSGLATDRWLGLQDVVVAVTIEIDIDSATTPTRLSELRELSRDLGAALRDTPDGSLTLGGNKIGLALGGETLHFAMSALGGGLTWEVAKKMMLRFVAFRGPSGKGDMTADLAEKHARGSLARFYSSGEQTSSKDLALERIEIVNSTWLVRFRDPSGYQLEAEFPADDPDFTVVRKHRPS